MRKFAIVMMALLVAGIVYGETDPKALPRIKRLEETLGRTKTSANTAPIKQDVISEKTAATGVTIDGVLLKDGSVTTTGAAGGDIILEEGAILRNDVVGDVELVYSNGTAVLGQVILDNSTDAAGIADDDLYEVVGRSVDSASNVTDYARIQLKIIDQTTATEDGAIILAGISGGAAADFLELGSTTAGALYGTFRPGMEVSLDGKYIAVGPNATTGVMLDGGKITFSSDGTVTQAFTSAYAGEQPVTLTYAGDPGSTNNPFVTSNDGTNFIGNGVATKSAYWTMIGTRP